MTSAQEAMIHRMESIHPLPPNGRESIAGILSDRRLSREEFFLLAGETPDKAGYMVRGWLRLLSNARGAPAWRRDSPIRLWRLREFRRDRSS